jgi:hypothetical protein
MSNLQRLLDIKFPMPEGMSSEGHRLFTVWREIFGEGYKAGYADRAEEHALQIPTPGYNREDVIKKCKELISDGHPLEAIALYKKATGYSATECKSILNL